MLVCSRPVLTMCANVLKISLRGRYVTFIMITYDPPPISDTTCIPLALDDAFAPLTAPDFSHRDSRLPALRPSMASAVERWRLLSSSFSFTVTHPIDLHNGRI
jgi:hypothetical protein